MRAIVKIFRFIEKLHGYTFEILRSTFKHLFDDHLEVAKALLVLSLTMAAATLTVANVVALGLHRRLLPVSANGIMSVWVTVASVATMINYFTLVNRNRWSKFQLQLQEASQVSRRIAGVAVDLGIFAVATAFIFTLSATSTLPR